MLPSRVFFITSSSITARRTQTRVRFGQNRKFAPARATLARNSVLWVNT